MLLLSTVWQRLAYSPYPWLLPLYPLGWLFRLITTYRRRLYRSGRLNQIRFSCPVIVVGNITIGGTGKTPTVMWLAEFLSHHGYRPGVVSKGYKGAIEGPHLVEASDKPEAVGDEPLLMAQQLKCPVVVSKKRAKGIQFLRNELNVDIVLMDDGMQHYAVARDYEIAVLDGQRGLGNYQCLPAGPLREPASRLETVDWLISQGQSQKAKINFSLQPSGCIQIGNPLNTKPLGAFNGTVHAVAGIGNPQRFFDTLTAAGITITQHAFADHHKFTADDFENIASECIIMTDKDAVKCAGFGLANAWRLSVVPHGLDTLGFELLNQLKG